GQPFGSHGQVQPAPSDRSRTRHVGPLRGSRRHQATVMTMHKVVLLRHGESTWNHENRFTGWTDVDLSAKGVDEAHAAGRLLRDEGYGFDIAYTSVLKRALRTCWIVLDELDQLWIPTIKSWRL